MTCSHCGGENWHELSDGRLRCLACFATVEKPKPPKPEKPKASKRNDA